MKYGKPSENDMGKNEVQVTDGYILLTRDTFAIPDDFVACWRNPNKTRWWMFWVPRYRYSYIAERTVETCR